MNIETKYRWQKINKKDTQAAEKFLIDIENDYVSACGRYLNRNKLKDPIWLLKGNDDKIKALVINSRSTIIPVLCGMQKIPHFDFLKNFFLFKKIHSIQGLKEEVIILEDAVKKLGSSAAASDIIDYELMSLDRERININKEKITENVNEIILNGRVANLVFKKPLLSDLDAVAPLQGAYEREEVIPAGSVFNHDASRINTANIIESGRILTALVDGRYIGKINVSAVSFTRFLIGGVFIHPDFRGKGIAKKMASVFINSLLNEGKNITLFVKKSNTAARRLYISLGFKTQRDYRITYY